MINFNKFYKLFNIISLVLVIASILLLFFKGLNFGVDFKGGTLIELRTNDKQVNITTLIAAIILFFMGSGPVKGFSVTLAVGIFTTLFSIYFIARMLTAFYVIKNKEKENLI